MTLPLEGQVALVTGAGNGIGRATAVALARAGADVLVHYRSSQDDAHHTAKLIEDTGRRAHLLACDLAERRAVAPFAVAAEAQWGGVDILVNNAGLAENAIDKTTSDADFLDHLDEWDKVMEVDLRAPFELTARLARAMKARGRGHVVNIASVAGMYALTDAPLYSLAKAGLLHFTRQAALMYAPTVRVNAVAPGWTTTAFGGGFLQDPEFQRQVSRHIPLKRMGAVDEMAAAVRYLCCDAPYTTGTTLTVDGGLVTELR